MALISESYYLRVMEGHELHWVCGDCFEAECHIAENSNWFNFLLGILDVMSKEDDLQNTTHVHPAGSSINSAI